MKITTVGIDLAKNVFQVHAVDERGRAVLRKQLRRDQMTAFFANLPPCLIGMEACASAHHWARTLQKVGHTVRLMAPQFVKPYVKSNKNDVADADVYLRTLLIHGARSAILAAQRKSVNTNVWLAKLLDRRHPNIAAVALANKNARTVWALLAHGREFRADYASEVSAA
jgi:transposase